MLTLGSMCSGYGGADLAVAAFLPVSLRWVSEVDPHACKVLEHRFPGVPNVGDLKTAVWERVEQVDIITAGYPCQPWSAAGRRAGVDDPRHLWPWIRAAVRVLRPRLLLLENVEGHLTLGFDAVLGDLAADGFDAEWTVVRASDVGACHRRARLFVAAHPCGLEPERRGGLGLLGSKTPTVAGEAPQREWGGHTAVDSGADAAHAPSVKGDPADRRADVGRRAGDPEQARLGDRTPPDPDEQGPQGPEPTPGRFVSAGCGGAPANAENIGRKRGGAHGDGGRDLRTAVADTYGTLGGPTAGDRKRSGM